MIGGQLDNGIVTCAVMIVFTDPTSSDTCSSSSIVLDSDSSTAGCGGSYTRTKTWHAVDACNNTSGTVSQTIMVEDNKIGRASCRENKWTAEDAEMRERKET